MIRKPPEGFPNWISFHDYLEKEKPELLKSKVIYCYVQKQNDQEYLKVKKLTMRTIRVNCWREIEELRPTLDEVNKIRMALHYSYYENNEFQEKASKFLKIISKLPDL